MADNEGNAGYRHRLADMLASGGVGFNDISKEILYMLPEEFMQRYIELWYAALGPLVKAPGANNERDADLGVAKTSTKHKGVVPGAGAGGIGKRLARNFSLRDEDAFKLKDRIDRKLRAIARELRLELADIQARAGALGNTGGITRAGERTKAPGSTGPGKSAPESTGLRLCNRCSKITGWNWRFCASCGQRLMIERPED